MKTLTPRFCQGCKCSFTPRPQHPKQEYCSSESCQKLRKAQWAKNKIKTDPAYKENQATANKRWQAKNPFYQQNYRKNKNSLAKNMDVSESTFSSKSGLELGAYRLTLIEKVHDKKDAWIVKIELYQ